jgi:hypothetical protein
MNFIGVKDIGVSPEDWVQARNFIIEDLCGRFECGR